MRAGEGERKCECVPAFQLFQLFQNNTFNAIIVHCLSCCHRLHHGSLQHAPMSQQAHDDRDDVDEDGDTSNDDDRLLMPSVGNVITSTRHR